ncbi:Rieske (2Fe-2S) protein [Mycobacterium sp. PS03-16]|uniref:Rieske (2Fe-2S) protein n=1 Tax=Mycobacterium sp. PS03-16 TaxID=2559611 RepID=UPI001073A628|nr:Rieske 2Fe-2S domain-containing protein [Mycobacterium sp. PS03-16]TFV60635.1 Rieske (2Fe-2S) protein [Mycobacterium sp. PS03-16]
MSVEVGRTDEIPVGEGRTYAVDDQQVAVYRMRDGSLRALAAVCPHRGGPLADGLTDDRVVVCPLHNYAYDLCTGAEVSGSGLSVRSYRVADVDGTIRIST